MRKTLLTTASGLALLFGTAAATAEIDTAKGATGSYSVAQVERERAPQTTPGAGAAERERDRPAATGTTGVGTHTFLSYEQNEEKFAGQTVQNMPAEEWIGRDVVDRQGDTIGSIEDLLIQEGKQEVTHALVEVGGFLGIGATRVALEIDELRPAEGAEGDVTTAMTREQLEALPHLQRTNGSWVPSEDQQRDRPGTTR